MLVLCDNFSLAEYINVLQRSDLEDKQSSRRGRRGKDTEKKREVIKGTGRDRDRNGREQNTAGEMKKEYLTKGTRQVWN